MNHAQRVAYMKQRIAKALEMPSVGAGIARVLSDSMGAHIDAGQGREGQFDPIKPITGTWFDRKGVPQESVSYRTGEQPLKDTGRLRRSLTASATVTGGTIDVKVGGVGYGEYQNRGITTTGPNFIPLTRKGARNYAGGTALVPGRLQQGKDYIMAWQGVTVPARNFVEPTPEDFHVIGNSIFTGLKLTLGGK